MVTSNREFIRSSIKIGKTILHQHSYLIDIRDTTVEDLLCFCFIIIRNMNERKRAGDRKFHSKALYLTFRLKSRLVELANISRVRGANFVAKTGPLDAANEFLSS